jgi:phosphonate transport system substrate-binding protein
MPQHFLAKAGVKPSQFSGGRAGFSGSHDATIAVVQSGAYEAGALNEQVWTSAVQDGRVNTEKVTVIWRTPEYVDYHWVVRPKLDQRFGKGFTTRLQKAILSLEPTTPRQATILELFAAKRFIPAEASQYKPIEKVGRELGKIR